MRGEKHVRSKIDFHLHCKKINNKASARSSSSHIYKGALVPITICGSTKKAIYLWWVKVGEKNSY